MIKRVSVNFGDNKVAVIEMDKSMVSSRLLGSANENMTSNELFLLSFIQRAMEIDLKGESIPYNLNPRKEQNQFDIIKCQWTEAGYLRIYDQSPDKKFRHAETVEQAMKRNRNFTCTRSLYECLPTRRIKGK